MSTAASFNYAPGCRSLEHLPPLMEARGVHMSAEEFHRTVNLVFHRFESEVYESVHRDMKESLPRVYNALADDWLSTGTVPSGLRVLDVGCGTGLSSEILLQTALGSRIKRIDGLDTSAEMLERYETRSALKGVRGQRLLGSLDRLPPNASYDLILVCSVLHHIPDLPAFLESLTRFQSRGGALLHLQDPNGDYLADDQLAKRCRQLENHFSRRVRPWARKLRPERLLRKLQRELTGKGEKNYIDLANDELMRRGVIAMPLTEMEIWQITEIHVFDGKGISLREMDRILGAYELVASRSYSFFGEMPSELPHGLKAEEARLFLQKVPNGQQISAIWRR